MKRKRILILLMIFLISIFTGCAENKESVKCVDIVRACKDAATGGTLDEWYSYGEELYDESFDNLYGVRFDMIDDGAVLQTSAGGVADEVSVLHLKKIEDVSIAKTKLQDRITERTHEFSGYKPEEVYKLDNARIVVQGNYVALIVSDDADQMEATFRNVISKGAE